jgi:hypothetical protein
LTPLCSPHTPFANYAHFSIDYENTSGDCIDFSANYAHNFDDIVNTPNDQLNIVADSADTLDISFVDFCIPNPALL